MTSAPAGGRRGAHLAAGDGQTSVLVPGGLTTQAVLMADRLLAAGLPATDVERVVQALSDGRRFSDLLVDLFCRLPAPPPLPTGPGTVVAVTGPIARALPAARQVAAELGTDPAHVIVLSLRGTPPSAVGTPSGLPLGPVRRGARLAPAADTDPALPAAARTDRVVRAIAQRRQRGTTVVVVVDTDFSGPQRAWAAHTLARLRPSAVWGVVDAVAKPEDVAAWATGLGGVDALVVDNVAATVSPAAVLRTGVPVARLDGQTATPERWAAAVGDLVAA